MVNTSKVLTVSYGTFSCTLEGFDDSFDTMKAIAEYFRDLAADDRYFGAEPPTPDAEMLAKIAEREVSRRVEAHSEGGNIVLRTTLPRTEIAPAAATLLSADADAIDTAQADQSAEQVHLAEQAEQDTRAQEKRVADEAAARAEQRATRRAARAAENKAAQEAANAADKQAAEQAAREAEQAANAELEAKAQAEAEGKAKAARLAKEQAEEAAQAEALIEAEAKRKADEDAAKLEEDDVEDVSENEPDSIAAKLARIRAVVGKPSIAPLATDFSEDEHAGDIMQGREDDTDLEDILEMDADADVEDSVEDTNIKTAVEDTISGVMSRLAEDTPELDSVNETAIAIDAEPAVADVVAPKTPIRARVIKMKRQEFEAAIASGDIEEEADDRVEETSLSVDDEAELARELAAVEAELSELPDDVSISEPMAEPVNLETLDYDETSLYEEIEVQNARGVDDLAVAPDVEMDRLMDQASTELDEPDGKKRRNALGHLRAAVASARADKKIGSNVDPVDETEEYRADLDTVVQPSRPVRRLSSNDAPAATARPPLKLVEEQRVDATVAESNPVASETNAPQPVRPRRIKVSDAPAQASPSEVFDVAPEGGTFNEFAEEMGATELPDLLEAAAAYLAYVEGKDQFSRPQLMTKVRMVQEENFSREDGLRSFGQLLRQGKIEKISGGRFTVSDRISFKPDTRAAG